jgi:hypothetical protein
MAITLDDESFGCRAKDNQVKKLNPWKSDKEGYACDALADCYCLFHCLSPAKEEGRHF